MDVMKILLAIPILFIGLVSTRAQSELDGTWQSEVETAGSLQLWSMELNQTGTNVTGTVWQGRYRDEILEGQIRGDRIIFKVDIPGQRTITFAGEIDGDEISFVREVEVAPGGQPGGGGIYGALGVRQFTVRRVPEGETPAEPRGLVWPRQLTLLDRDGDVVRELGQPDEYMWPVLSPDGQRLVAIRPDRTQVRITTEADPEAASEVREMWVFDISTGERTLVASVPSLWTPVWSPDGRRIAYSSYREGHGGIYQIELEGAGRLEQRLYQFPLGILPVVLDDWSYDGRFLGFGGGLLSVLPLDGEPTPVEILREEYSAFGGNLSPDSRFVAYMSNESGRMKVNVQAFDPSSVQLSVADKWEVAEISSQYELPDRTDRRVRWRRDGGELYYQNDDLEVMAITVSTVPEFRAEPPRLLFRAPNTGPHGWRDSFLDISADGQRFLLAVPERPEITVVPEILASYAGTYELERDSSELVVTLEEGRLWSQAEDEDERVGPMIARSETSFYSNRFGEPFDVITPEEIDFIIDDQGNVTHLVTYNNGVGWKAIRR